MRNFSALLVMLFLGFGIAHAEKSEDVNRYRGYTNNFIFTEGGIEFAVFPDGQFDFNFLDFGPQVAANVNLGNVNISFNTGYNYDRFVQYDTYGAVIQIENTPIYYDAYGRIIQAGNVVINYRNGFVNNIGNLYVNYSRPGVILNYRGYINAYNRAYVYRPYHRFYAAPIVDRVVVFGSPYRRYYNPIRFSFNFHRNYWNSPSYYNGCYAPNRGRRSFYRPYDRVDYRSYERGRRDRRGRAIASGRHTMQERRAYATGRKSIKRNNRVASRSRSNNVRSSEQRTGRSSVANRGSQGRRLSGNKAITINRGSSRSSAITGRTSSRGNSRSGIASRSNRNEDRKINRPSTSRSSRSVGNARATKSRSQTRAVRGNRATSTRSKSGNARTSSRSTARKSRSTASERSSRAPQAKSSSRVSRSRSAAPKRSKASAPSRKSSTVRKSSSTRSRGKSSGRSSSRRSTRRG
jgi:hypothetical protein